MVTQKTGGKRRRDLRRPGPTRLPRPFILIVCEGGKTEPNYFNGFRRKYRIPHKTFEACGGRTGSHPKSVVKSAIEIRKKKAKDNFYYDKIFCVFDFDDHENIHEAIDQAKAHHFEVIFSNPCFELWFLLHYQDKNSEIHRDTCTSELKRHIHDYDKAMEGLYDRLLDKQEEAINRAIALRNRHRGNGDDETKNPSTNVDKIAVYLNHLKKDK